MISSRTTTSTYSISAKENIAMPIPASGSSNSLMAWQPSGQTSPRASCPSMSTLGKRQRDSTSSDIAENVEGDYLENVQPEKLAQHIMKRDKKRARLDTGEPIADEDAAYQTRHPSQVDDITRNDKQRDPKSPPPVEYLPEISEGALRNVDACVSSVSHHSAKSSNGTFERQFDFDFVLPATSTPCVIARTNAFNQAQMPFTPRDAITADGRSLEPGVVVDRSYLHPNNLSASPERSMTEGEERLRMETRKDADIALRPRSPICVQVLETPARPMQKTLYGTEVEVDRRFGDFGRDGVATAPPFWLGSTI